MTPQPPNLEPPCISTSHLLLALAVGLCLLLPTTLAHNTTGGRLGGLSGGVSGNYVGPAGPAVGDSWAATYTAPFYAMVCNLESANGGALDETVVDGAASPLGLVPDGTWDDGGYGGACHDLSSQNCQAGTQAFASDAVFGGNVFLAAACDWKTDLGGPSTELALSFCMANNALGFNPLGNLAGEVVPFADCGVAAVDCVLNPACGATGNVQVCGADGVIDAANYGYGGGLFGTFNPAIFPANTGAYVGPCPDGIAAVYVLSFVDTYDGTPNLYMPTTGWIDSSVPLWWGGGSGGQSGAMGHCC